MAAFLRSPSIRASYNCEPGAAHVSLCCRHFSWLIGILELVRGGDHLRAGNHSGLLVCPIWRCRVIAVRHGQILVLDARTIRPTDLEVSLMTQCIECRVHTDLRLVPSRPVQPGSTFD